MGVTTGTSGLADGRTGPGIRFERRGATVVITLDRAAKLNAIDSAMKAAIAAELPRIARDPQVYAVLLRAVPGRVFSAGGDIRELCDLAIRDPSGAAAETAREYSLTWQLDCFPKPCIALIDGPVMGTGAGLVHAVTHRVAGAGYRFQMPETLIGYFPDNGVSWHLARLPDEIGTWLALTGAAIGRADAWRLGLVTQCIEATDFEEIGAAVADAQPIDPELDGRHVDPGPAPIDRYAEVIARCFSADSTAEILDLLAAEKTERDWCDAQLATLAGRSPRALEATLQLLRRARHLDMRQMLMVEQRLGVRLLTGHDFIEGVRRRIIEKSGEPIWRPSTLSDLGPGEIERLFDPLPEGELVLPTAQEMLARM
jgi:enoyl-CoA hydratase